MKKKIIFVSLFLITFYSLAAQYQVTGVVLSPSQEPVPGATIVANNDENTVTNVNGEFSLDRAKEGLEITISSVGFNPITMIVSPDDFQNIKIILTESISNLPEVLVQSVTMTGGLAHVHKNIGSAHFIGQKEIQRFSYSDINRTLRNIPGVVLQEEDGYGLRPNIGLRASGSERSSKISVMEDGILAAPAPYAAPSAYYFPTIGRMEAVEIMKGSSQIKYGPFTTGGAINLISTPIPLDFSGHGDLIFGSDGYRMIHANVGNSHKNVGYMVETFQLGADGFKQLDGGGNTGFDKRDYLAKLKFNTNPDAKIYQSLLLKVGISDEESNETYLGLTEQDFELTPFRRYAASAQDVMTTSQSQVTLTHHISPTTFLDVVTSAYRNDFSRNWYKLDRVNGSKIAGILSNPSDFTTEMGMINGSIDSHSGLSVKANNRSYYGKGVQSTAIMHWNTKGMSHKIDLGFRIHEDQIDRFQWIDDYSINDGVMQLVKGGTPGTESNRVETAYALAAFAQYKLEWNNLTITPGLRYENVSVERMDYGKSDIERTGVNLSERKNQVDIWIPGIGVNYDWNKSLSTFGGLHKGFAPPGSKEGTMPEESWNYEAGIRLMDNGWRFQALAYLNDYCNLLGSDLAATGGQGTTDLFNGGEAIAKGLEIEGTYDILYLKSNNFKLPISAAYTYTDAYFEGDFDSDFGAWGNVSNGYKLPYLPTHQFSFSLSLDHEKFLFDISTRYNGAMLTSAGLFENSQTPRIDSYFTADVSLNYKVTPAVSAFINLNNVLDKTYVVSMRPAGLRPGLSRTLNLGIKGNF